MDKIYSRKRLKIPSFKGYFNSNKDKNSKSLLKRKLKISLFLIIFGLLIIFIVLFYTLYPIFENKCKAKAESIAISISTNEINELMKNYNYDDLVYIQREDSGKITMIKVKISPINEIMNKVAENIENRIDNNSTTSVEMNIGKITGITLLSVIGPRFKIKMETSRSE